MTLYILPRKYFVIKQALPYRAAAEACKALNGHLAVFDSPEAYADSGVRQPGGFWIGINDIEAEGVYVAEPDGERVSVTNWRAGEPNNVGGNEDCVMVDGSTGQWNDGNCEHSLPAFCQSYES